MRPCRRRGARSDAEVVILGAGRNRMTAQRVATKRAGRLLTCEQSGRLGRRSSVSACVGAEAFVAV
jgi:hypothetical protein